MMFGTLNELEIEQVLITQSIGRIGCHANGRTYVVPINYVYEGGALYFLTHEGLKLQMMRENPEVCFETDVQQTANTWKSVIGWGRFEEITKPADRVVAFKTLLGTSFPFLSKALKTEFGIHFPFIPDNLDEIKGVVFRIVLNERTGRFDTCDSLAEIAIG